MVGSPVDPWGSGTDEMGRSELRFDRAPFTSAMTPVRDGTSAPSMPVGSLCSVPRFPRTLVRLATMQFSPRSPQLGVPVTGSLGVVTDGLPVVTPVVPLPPVLPEPPPGRVVPGRPGSGVEVRDTNGAMLWVREPARSENDAAAMAAVPRCVPRSGRPG